MAITMFDGFTQPILPAVLGDSFSYFEVIQSLIAKTNELVEQVNNLENVSNDYTDKEISALRTDIEKQIYQVNVNLSDAISVISAKESTDFNYLDTKINAVLATATTKIETAIKEYNTWLMDYLSKQILDIKVIDYYTGNKVSIQEMFNILAVMNITNGLTYQQMIDRGYTYGEIISISNNGHYTYQDFVLNANTILPTKA